MKFCPTSPTNPGQLWPLSLRVATAVRSSPLPRLPHARPSSGDDGRQASDWLRRAQRLAPPPVRPISVAFRDACRDELAPDAPYLRAFELCCVRAGIKLLSLSARGVAGIGDAVAIHRPNIVVIAGGH